MSHRIHEWDKGPSRELFKGYNYGTTASTVAYAIVVGVLDDQEVPEEVLEATANWMSFFRELQERGDLRDREGQWWIG
jgi:hypothetical protein